MTGTKAGSGTTGDARWLDRRENVARVYRGVWVVCALLLLAEPLVHKHAGFSVEAVFGFYGWYGFACCVGLVLAAKVLRRLVKRPEDFYER
jgi:asparagine N-glycosylation enzyme membrane subunit Stt3